MARIPSDVLEQAAVDILTAVNVPRDEAQTIARSLVVADLWCVFSDGISRLPIYVRRIRADSFMLRHQQQP